MQPEPEPAPTPTPAPSNGNHHRGGLKPRSAPPPNAQFPWWDPDSQFTAEFDTPLDKPALGPGQSFFISASSEGDTDTRYTDDTTSTTEYDTLNYSWTCSAGRLVNSSGTPTLPGGNTSTYWQAKDANNNNLPAGPLTITCTVSDDAQRPPNEFGSRKDTDVVLTLHVVVVMLSWDMADTLVPVNDNYDEGNHDASGIRAPDNAQNWTGTPPHAEDKLLATDTALRSATVTIHAGAAGAVPGWLNFQYDGSAKLWYDDNGTWTPINTEGGTVYVDTGALDLLVEGITASPLENDLHVQTQFYPADPYFEPDNNIETINSYFTVVQADLQVSVPGMDEGSPLSDEEQPGAFVPINDDYDEGNHDAGSNPVRDNQADNAAGQRIVDPDDELVPMRLQLSPALGGEWTMTVPSNVMVWWNDGGTWRDASAAGTNANGSHPVTAGTSYIDMKVEGMVLGSSTSGIVLTFKPTGATATYGDKVITTVVKFDLDVNHNGSLANAVDLAENYLPGYEGNDRKVSTGTSFNTPVYVGQQMALMIDGVGTGSHVDSVDFSITDVTSLPGYCENGFHADVGTTGTVTTDTTKDDDYSFSQTGDQTSHAGTLGTGSTTVPFWCKDYGGKCVAHADIKVNGTTIATLNRAIPFDADNDGIADRWELEKVREWNTQFGASETVNNQFFNGAETTESTHAELADPDDGRTDAGRFTFSMTVPTNNPATQNDASNMGIHAITGDHRTAFQEYRGYIVDGGGFDASGSQHFDATGIKSSATPTFAGGHIRLTPAVKEVMVAVDAMTSVTHMPNPAGIQDWMNSVARYFAQRQDGTGCRMYYVVHDTSTSHNTFAATATQNEEQVWLAYVDALQNVTTTPGYAGLTSFKHLQLVEVIGTANTAGVGYNDHGALVAANTMYTYAGGWNIPLNTYAASYISHELHHTIITRTGDNEDVACTINGTTCLTGHNTENHEHFDDTNGNHTSGDADDKERVLWNYNSFQYANQLKHVATAPTGNDQLALADVTNLTAHGIVRVGAQDITYTGITGHTLTGCNPHPSTAITVGADVEPQYSYEEMKQTLYGYGTVQYVDSPVP